MDFIKARLLISMTFLLLVISLSLFACRKETKIKMGDPAPDFILPKLNGELAKFSEYKSKVVLLFFWADWCLFCKTGMGKLDKLYRNLRGSGFEVVAVNVSQPQTQVSSFVNKLGLSFPILLDEKPSVATKIYGVVAIPTFFLVDHLGVVKEMAIGDLNDEQVFKIIEPYIRRLEKP